MRWAEYAWDRPYASVQRSGGGPERVKEEKPPEGWKPPTFRGFVPPAEPDPVLWEGDGA